MNVRCTPTNLLDGAALEAALSFCGSASRLEAAKVGWIPLAAYRGAHDQGRIIVCTNNDDLVGFCMYQHKGSETKVYQIWVRPDARLILHGRALITTLAETTAPHGAAVIRLWCAEDLAANLFWRALGFANHGYRWGPKRTSKRRHWLWVRRTRDILAEDLSVPPLAIPRGVAARHEARQPLPTPPTTCREDTPAGRTT